MQLTRLWSRLHVLMASIASVAFGLAALRDPSLVLVAIVLVLTATVLAAAAFLGSARSYARGPDLVAWFQPLWLALFLLAGSSWRDQLPARNLVHRVVDWLTSRYGPYPTPTGKRPFYDDAMQEANRMYAWSTLPLVDLYLTLVVVLAGATLTWAVAGLVWGAIAHVTGRRKRNS